VWLCLGGLKGASFSAKADVVSTATTGGREARNKSPEPRSWGLSNTTNHLKQIQNQLLQLSSDVFGEVGENEVGAGAFNRKQGLVGNRIQIEPPLLVCSV
jgi:hypothetical protein